MQVQYSAFSYTPRSGQSFYLVQYGTLVTGWEGRVDEGREEKKRQKNHNRMDEWVNANPLPIMEKQFSEWEAGSKISSFIPWPSPI